MNALTLSILICATLGSGLMAGLFCSFSNFVMQALSKIPPQKGIAAMQSINLVIVRPTFLFVFLGTGFACALSIVLGWERMGDVALAWTAAGGAVYVLGSIVVTMMLNVPLNNRLAAVDSETEEGARAWEMYLVKWTRWNHVRSIATMTSTVFLVVAVLHANCHG